jgi:hypothetical protein
MNVSWSVRETLVYDLNLSRRERILHAFFKRLEFDSLNNFNVFNHALTFILLHVFSTYFDSELVRRTILNPV